MAENIDDLEAVRQIVEILKPFQDSDRERIIRWSKERLGMVIQHNQTSIGTPGSIASHGSIKGFVEAKQPKTDSHFAAVVAYFYKFEARDTERKDFVDAQTLLDACRLAQVKRLSNPLNTLHNTVKLGLLDKGAENGTFAINTVGENLVAMVLPATGQVGKPAGKAKSNTKKAKKKSNKKAAKKK